MREECRDCAEYLRENRGGPSNYGFCLIKQAPVFALEKKCRDYKDSKFTRIGKANGRKVQDRIEKEAKETAELRAEVAASRVKIKRYEEAIRSATKLLGKADRWLKEGKVTKDSIIGEAAGAYRELRASLSNEGDSINEQEEKSLSHNKIAF